MNNGFRETIVGQSWRLFLMLIFKEGNGGCFNNFKGFLRKKTFKLLGK